MNLKGKVCLVTGGTSGIGTATARKLMAKGAQIVTASRNGDSEGCHALRRDAEEHGVTMRCLTTDVADAEACRRCVDKVREEFGRMDVLVHCAGGTGARRSAGSQRRGLDECVCRSRSLRLSSCASCNPADG